MYCTLAIIKASVLKNILNLCLYQVTKQSDPPTLWEHQKDFLNYMQNYNQNKNTKTQFSIVIRKALESSGSVIPKFKKQINEGGPNTYT